MYSDLTVKNKSLLKRFSHGARFKIATQLIGPAQGDKILDFGTGDGYMLKQLQSVSNDCSIVGYEPIGKMFEELQKSLDTETANGNIEIVQDYKALPNDFNKIACLEVLEHLPPEKQIFELERIAKLLSFGGILTISVPIEGGFSSLLKNTARILLGQTHHNTSLKTVLLSLFGRPIDRGNTSYIPSHIGFYYKDLEKVLSSLNMKVEKRLFSPMPWLGGLINSQVFYVVRMPVTDSVGYAS